MIIDCISDLHGHSPKLEGGDLLIVAGDLTARDNWQEHGDFKKWLYEQEYQKKIVIAGNHDNHFVALPGDPYIFSSYNMKNGEQLSYAEYLCDSGTEFEGLKIWGCPWTKRFEGMNSNCMAFTVDTDKELAEKWALIPDDTDILITHSPSWGILDHFSPASKSEWFGSLSLRARVEKINPKLHVCAHIHEGYGKMVLKGWGKDTICINPSIMNRWYEPVNKPIQIQISNV